MNLIFSCSGKHFAPPVAILLSINSRGVGTQVSIEDCSKNVEYLSLHQLTLFHHCLSGALHLLLPSFSSSHTCRSPSCYSLCPLQGSVPASGKPSLPHSYITNLSLYSSQVFPVLVSIICAFTSFVLAWSAVPWSAMLVPSFPCPVSCSWGLLGLVHYGRQKNPLEKGFNPSASRVWAQHASSASPWSSQCL